MNNVLKLQEMTSTSGSRRSKLVNAKWYLPHASCTSCKRSAVIDTTHS
ncbi:hypothetical protein CWC29_016560 [Pseudoalteromonas sp. S4498]|uniref:Uncharacterized protein n=1 Tax=Pseudoalteromonas galatheae TaxID=579562 RepID=A0A8T6YWF4_9GAMM|nr:hypothetical protein [Pseudoalteromonas galatheae]NKC20410.1 hypothetical protein [Pseudoalteromonas galatheae]